MSAKYLVWYAQSEGNSCVLGPVVGFDSNRLRYGPEFPNDMRLLDNVQNLEGFVLVSNRLREFLEGCGVEQVEFLPVSVVNHKGRSEAEPFYVVNPIGAHDVLDIDASGPEFFDDTILTVMQTVIREDELDPALDLVRLARFANPTLIKRELAAKIDAAEFSGICWRELEKYEG
jgi:hypothetical protein